MTAWGQIGASEYCHLRQPDDIIPNNVDNPFFPPTRAALTRSVGDAVAQQKGLLPVRVAVREHEGSCVAGIVLRSLLPFRTALIRFAGRVIKGALGTHLRRRGRALLHGVAGKDG